MDAAAGDLGQQMSVVASVTADSWPPMTPASATGRSASAITSISGVSDRVSPSRQRRRSPGRARRTTIRRPAIRDRSKACSGCPYSSAT
jgi:hypothetical protein